MVTAAVYNTDIIDNLDFLKGRAGAVDFESAINSDTDDTDDVGTPAIRWRNIHGVDVFGSRFKCNPNVREVRLVFEDDPDDMNNITVRTAVGGAVAKGGTGQVVLAVDRNAADIAGIEQLAEQDSALDNSWNPTQNCYIRVEFSLAADDANVKVWAGFRQTLGGALPAPASENFAGISWDGSSWVVENAEGTARTTTTVTPAAGQRHVIEVFCQGTTNVEYWLDGVKSATHTTRLPTGDMEWQVLILGNSAGGASTIRLTGGEIVLQEDLA